MTNWPNIQEFRNFGTKLFDEFKPDSSSSSSLNNDCESLIKTKCDPDDGVSNQIAYESKTVRCVIKKDFEESFKKFDRGDGLIVNNESTRPKIKNNSLIDQTFIDKVRLQNHLKWKKQKEEEYLQKKQAQRAALERKREEEIRLERIKKQREKEREKKVKEWEEQKAREKEGKKKEKMIMKVLEEELKEATPVIDKEKLIEDWVRLKDRQRQMEAEKKAEILKRQEESRAFRQNLAALSYRQWKEKIKGKITTLPKNGYQIFGPKPVPVVKEDWNHNFICNSPRSQIFGLRNSRSNTTNSITFRSGAKEVENSSKDNLYLGNLNRSPSFSHIKKTKSGLDLGNGGEMPLKELQPGTIDLLKNFITGSKSNLSQRKEQKTNLFPCDANFGRQIDNSEETSNGLMLPKEAPPPFLHLPIGNDYQNTYDFQSWAKNLKLMPEKQENKTAANKKKIDVYLNDSHENSTRNFRVKLLNNSNEDVKLNVKERKKNIKEKITQKDKSFPKKTSDTTLKKSETFNNSQDAQKNLSGKKSSLQIQTKTVKKDKICRRSRSYDKPVKKILRGPSRVKGCSSSKSLIKTAGRGHDGDASLSVTKSKPSNSQKKKTKKQSKPNSANGIEKINKNIVKPEVKVKQKLKKKNNNLSKSFSFSDSPYYVKKTATTTSDKVKGGPRKGVKDGETKSDGAGRCRNSSKTKL